MDISQTQTPPLLPPVIAAPVQKSLWRRFVSILLSVCLVLFMLDAALSLVDETFGLLLRTHAFRALRGIASLFAVLVGFVVYLSMAITPMIPKRLFIPIALFSPLIALITLPLVIFYYDKTEWIGLGLSMVQVVVGLLILRLLKRNSEQAPAVPQAANANLPLGEPASSTSWFLLVPASRLSRPAFTWSNFLGFVATNLFLLLPAVLVYLYFCSSLAVGHLSQGFVKLNSGGLTTQARTYARDGKTIQLVPMAHVGDAKFYRQITESFPSNSVILMEGVSDEHNLLTNKVSYHRMASTLGLSEQQKEFKPVAGDWVNADIDIHEFNPTTIDLLNLVMLIHARGVNVQTLLPLSQYAPPPDIQTQIWDDLLHKRNRHLLGELRQHLTNYDYVVIPWGAAHMPELSQEIRKSGFRQTDTKDYRVIKFW